MRAHGSATPAATPAAPTGAAHDANRTPARVITGLTVGRGDGVRCAAMAASAPVPTVQSTGGLVATADQQATAAGIVTLARGGNAVDAAIAANAAMAVVAPHLCGLGGDLFALVHSPGDTAPVALDAAGRAGSGADPDRAAAPRATEPMPFKHDIRTVTVPGCVDGWMAAARAVRPAAAWPRCWRRPSRLAEEGFAASPLLVASAGRQHRAPPGAGQRGAAAARPRSGARGCAASGWPARCGPSPPAAVPRSTAASSARACCALGDGHYTADDLARPRTRAGSSPVTAEACGHRLWTHPAGVAGLPHAGRRRGSPTACACPTTPTTPTGPTCWSRRPSPPATTATRSCGEGADGAALLATGAPGAPPGRHLARPSGRVAVARADARRRHHVPVRGRRRRHGRVAHPVERLGLRQPPVRAVHRHQPAQPRPRLLARARPPGRAGPGPPPAAHAVARAGHAPRRPPGRRRRHDGRRRPAADPAAGGRPGCSGTASARACAVGSPRWVLAGERTGFDTWSAPAARGGASRTTRRRHGPKALARPEVTRSVAANACRADVGHATPSSSGADGMLGGRRRPPHRGRFCVGPVNSAGRARTAPLTGRTSGRRRCAST